MPSFTYYTPDYPASVSARYLCSTCCYSGGNIKRIILYVADLTLLIAQPFPQS